MSVIDARPVLSTRQYGWALATVAIVILPHLLWLPLPVVSISLGFLAACWWFSQRKHAVKVIPAWIRLGLVAVLCGLILSRYGTLLGRHAGASLLVTMLALKAAECKSSRDVRVMVTIGFFVMVAAFLFNDSPLLAIYMFIATGIGFAAMEALEQRPGEHSLLFARLGWRQVFMLLVISLPLTLVLWLFFPRMSTPLWGTPEQVGRTGLSDRMQPGDITNLMTDDSVVLRITFDGALPDRSQLYFRGPTLWYYNGESWLGAEAGSLTLAGRELETRADLSYSVYQEPTDKRWLFALDRPSSISIPAFWTRDQQLLSEEPIVGPLSYTASSQLSGPWRPHQAFQRELNLALRLPPALDPKTTEFGAGLQREYGTDRQAIVDRVLRLFTEEKFFYSLDPPPLGLHRHDEFLFSTRTGFCEHYASAFTALMRAAGVPSRVVLGYLGGVFNVSGNYLAVRNADAHAWSEVFIDGSWRRVDPTAAIAPERVNLEGGGSLIEDTSFWTGVGRRWDALGQYWRDFVVQFNALKQSRLLRPFGIEQADWEQLGLALSVLGSLLALLGSFFLWHYRPSFSRNPWLRGWKLLRQKLLRAGVSLPVCMGPQAATDATRQRLGTDAQAAIELLGQLEQSLYSTNASSPHGSAEFLRAVRRLRLRKAAKPGDGGTQ